LLCFVSTARQRLVYIQRHFISTIILCL